MSELRNFRSINIMDEGNSQPGLQWIEAGRKFEDILQLGQRPDRNKEAVISRRREGEEVGLALVVVTRWRVVENLHFQTWTLSCFRWKLLQLTLEEPVLREMFFTLPSCSSASSQLALNLTACSVDEVEKAETDT